MGGGREGGVECSYDCLQKAFELVGVSSALPGINSLKSRWSHCKVA